ncbi:MAG TPA: CRISPR-associated protein Cas4 [Bryobacteraceae bacterium]|nr:CRISPR-associated protein Cas4 [Bryobacteraceae bacterium]
MSQIPVTDLKQWAYCARVVYYHRVLPGAAQPTWKMREAVSAQDMIERLELRRGLREYGWEGGDRRFGIWLAHEGLGLSGKLDLLLEREGEGAVVDFKLTSGEMGDNHRMQLTGYAMLAEACCGLRVETAFLYRIPDDRVFAFAVTAAWKQRVTDAITAIGELERTAWCPEPTPVRARCAECEYVNYCADIW